MSMFRFGTTKKKLNEALLEKERLHEQMMQNMLREQQNAERLQAIQKQLEDERMRNAYEEIQRQERHRKEQERIMQERAAKERAELAQKEREIKRREARMAKIRLISPEALCHLRELIRKRYELDIEIWGLRGVRKPDRYIVEEKMEKADTVLAEIIGIVNAWEGTERSWTPVEWAMVEDIRARIQADNKRWWAGNPPWNDE